MQIGDLLRIALTGELDLSAAAAVEAALFERAGARRLVLDLRRLTFMDSSGLRMILAANTRARREGWTLRIVPGPPAVQRVFEICGVDDQLAFVEPS